MKEKILFDGIIDEHGNLIIHISDTNISVALSREFCKALHDQIIKSFDEVVAGDWEFISESGEGVFELKSDPTKKIDVSLSGNDVRCQLENLALRLSTEGAFGGFYNTLRRKAVLKKKSYYEEY